MRHLLRDTRGATIVEFAILAPVMILLLSASIEMGHVIQVRSNLEGAVIQAARTALVDMTKTESERETAMRTQVTSIMSEFETPPGKEIEISTRVYASLGRASSEPFTDLNHDGTWTAAHGEVVAEPFVDRNANGVWDAAQAKAGTMGGIGDVVSYTAIFPIELYFPFLKPLFGGDEGFTVSATTVVRNEPVVRKASGT